MQGTFSVRFWPQLVDAVDENDAPGDLQHLVNQASRVPPLADEYYFDSKACRVSQPVAFEQLRADLDAYTGDVT